MRLILLGAPGAGKGTQAAAICDTYGIPAISTGSIIREAVKNDTSPGRKAKDYIESGNLVPDEIVIEMLKARIVLKDCDNGFILDGFPRTVPQAEALDKMGVVIDRVIDIEVSDSVILERLSGRQICSDCSTSFHLRYNPSQKPGICDKCQGELEIRYDDHPETIRERLRIYHESTEPLKDYYNAVGKLYVVEGQEALEHTTKLTLAAIEA